MSGGIDAGNVDLSTVHRHEDHPADPDTTRNDHLSEVVSDAHQAMELRSTNPKRAAAIASRILADKAAMPDARGIAGRVMALISLEAGDIAGAQRHAAAAVRLAKELPVGAVRDGILVTASGVMMFAGKVTQALGFLDRALAESQGAPSFDLEYQRAWVLARAGRPAEAVKFAHLLSQRVDLGDRDRADASALEASLSLEQGAYRAALPAVQRTIEYYAQRETTDDLIYAYNNAGVLLGALGELPKALQMLDEAQRRAKDLGQRVQTWTTIARAWTCLWGNLHEEAYAAAEQAWELAVHTDLETRAECGLVLMRAAQASGRTERALAAARLTRPMKRKGGKLGHARACHLVLLQQRAVGPATLRQLSDTALQVGRATHPTEIVAAHLGVLETALRLGDPVIADRHRIVLRSYRASMPALEQASVWLGDAMWHEDREQPTRARRSVATGLNVLRRHRDALGSTELRIAASERGESLARIGLRLALSTGRARDVLTASEAWRAQGSLRRGRHSADAIEALDQLRGVVARARDDGIDESARSELLKRQIELEDRVTVLARHAGGDDRSEQAPDVATLLDAVGDRTLVSYVVIDSQLAAVVYARRRLRLVRLRASTAAVATDQQKLAFSLRRLSRPDVPPSVRAAARTAADRSLLALDQHLVVPIGRQSDLAETLIVAPAALHAVPWASLAGLDSNVVTVMPSATLLTRSAEAKSHRAVFCTGPRLAAVDAEVAESAAYYPASLIVGQGADTDVLSALDGARVAHLACHGNIRADNPLFSSLELHSGPLTVYDLERLGATPDTMVLAACDSGVGAVRPGDELLGFTSALFAGGTRSVIASVIPVPDVATASLMTRLHQRMASGVPPAGALREARELTRDDSDHGFVASVAFSTFGVR